MKRIISQSCGHIGNLTGGYQATSGLALSVRHRTTQTGSASVKIQRATAAAENGTPATH